MTQTVTNTSLKPLLVIEDNPGLQKQLKWSFENYNVLIAGDRESAMKQLKEHKPVVVTLDLGLPPDPANASQGFAVLEEILRFDSHIKVIVVTGNDDQQNALRAIAMGAYDFYEKPIDPDILGLIIGRAYKLRQLEDENRRLAELSSQSPLEGIVGSCPQMQALFRMVEKIGPSEATAMILGESGTGKELFARALHNLSPRKNKPFMAVNCAAIPENLLESELFGYEKGAFTGAVKQTLGKIEFAEGGTFFLDEIGDMPMALQAKMLRFLQERVVERVGGRVPIPVDVRIICATHQNLEKLINEHVFRQDLYYRISEIIIEIPPLRQREGDRVLLAQALLEKCSRKNSRTFRGFTADALERIDAYAWPGNVRELENKIGRAVILAEGKRIDVADLGFSQESASLPLNLRQAREQVESKIIQRALGIHNHNISHTAAALDVSRPALYQMMKKLGLSSARE